MFSEAEFSNLIPAYALGILSESEAGQVAIHLQSCASCQAELAQYQLMVDNLSLTGPEVRPPDNLEEQLLSRIQSPEPKLSSVDLNGSSTQRSPWSAKGAWFGLAYGLLGLLLISNIILLNMNWRDEELHRDNLPTDISDEMRDHIMETIPLFPTDLASEAHGTIVIGMDGDKGAVVVEDLPLIPADKQYQLWLAQDGQKTSGGLITIDGEGYGAIVITAPQPLNQYSGFGVSIEATGGSNSPTGGRVLRWGSEWNQ